MSATQPSFAFSAKTARTVPQPINYLITVALQDKKLISLAAGLVDAETLPAAEVTELSARLLARPGGKLALQYGDTCGLRGLRQAVLEHVCKLDGVTPEQINATADSIMCGSGSQQLLYFISDVLLDPGDIVITEWPSYFVYTAVLVSLGASVRAVEMDDDGMKLDDLESTLEQLKQDGQLHRVKIVYTCDYYQNPTGITLSPERRQRMLEIVQRYSTGHRICLLEDAAYRELSADAAAPPTIKSYERTNAQVVLAQTFSKPFSPGLRTGYAILPSELAKAVMDQKGNSDFGSSNFTQHILLEAMQSGIYGTHVQKLRQRYRAKRDAMLAALERQFGVPSVAARTGASGAAETAATRGIGPIRWTRPAGGLYVYMTLPEGFDTGKDGALFAAAMKEGVLYVPGEYCYGPDPRRQVPRNELRLTFGTVDEAQIEQGVQRLARAIAQVAAVRQLSARGGAAAPSGAGMAAAPKAAS